MNGRKSAHAFDCLNCGSAMVRTAHDGVWHCRQCRSAATTTAAARKLTDPKLVRQVWLWAKESGIEGTRACPGCDNNMREAFADESTLPKLDVCTRCQMIWFDATELDAIPKTKRLSAEAARAVQLHEAELKHDRPRTLQVADYDIAHAVLDLICQLAAVVFRRL